MASRISYYDMSDEEDDPRLSLAEDDEPRAIEEIVEGEVEAFNGGETDNGVEDMDFLFGDGGEAAAPADGAVEEEKEKKARKSMGPKMNTVRLKGPLGIRAVDEVFKDFKLRGRGHEKDDLDKIIKRMQDWTHRMYPRFAFPDCVEQIEWLGQKLDIKVFMRRHRNEPIPPEEEIVTQFEDENEGRVDEPTWATADPMPAPDPFDNFVRPPSPPPLSAEELERIQLNRDAAIRRRLEKMREREMQAGGALTTANQAPIDAVLATNQTAEDEVSVANQTVVDVISKANEIPMEEANETPMEEISSSDEMQIEVALSDSESPIKAICEPN